MAITNTDSRLIGKYQIGENLHNHLNHNGPYMIYNNLNGEIIEFFESKLKAEIRLQKLEVI